MILFLLIWRFFVYFQRFWPNFWSRHPSFQSHKKYSWSLIFEDWICLWLVAQKNISAKFSSICTRNFWKRQLLTDDDNDGHKVMTIADTILCYRGAKQCHFVAIWNLWHFACTARWIIVCSTVKNNALNSVKIIM